MRLLIVDDSPQYVTLLEHLLMEHETEARESLASALALLGEQKFDCILLDLALPDSAPRTTLKNFFRAGPTAAVVVVTGNTNPKVMEQSFEFGAHGYLVKQELTKTILDIVIYGATAVKQRELENELRMTGLAERLAAAWTELTADLFRGAEAVNKTLASLYNEAARRDKEGTIDSGFRRK